MKCCILAKFIVHFLDGEKFGQKMLEKMGWTSGKGLGANEQGITEHVRVSVKNDKSGKNL